MTGPFSYNRQLEEGKHEHTLSHCCIDLCLILHISRVDAVVSRDNQEGKETSLGKHLSKFIFRNSSGGLEGLQS